MDTLKAYYEAQAAGKWQAGDAIDGRVRKAARLFTRHLGRAESLLDIGCGVGTIGLYLGEALGAKEVYGVEIATAWVEEARKNGLKAFQVDLNQEGLPFEDNSFDAIFCGEIIEHLVDPDHLLDEVRRTLTDAGLCVLTTPNLAWWINRFALLLGWQPFQTSTSRRHEVGRPKFLVSAEGCRQHLQVFTYGALKELLSLNGLSIVAVTGTGVKDTRWNIGDWSIRPYRALLYRLVQPLDLLVSLLPSLGCGIVIAFKRGQET